MIEEASESLWGGESFTGEHCPEPCPHCSLLLPLSELLSRVAKELHLQCGCVCEILRDSRGRNCFCPSQDAVICLSNMGDVFGITLRHVTGDARILLCLTHSGLLAAGCRFVAGEAALSIEVCGRERGQVSNADHGRKCSRGDRRCF
jgi:hypothetical protein